MCILKARQPERHGKDREGAGHCGLLTPGCRPGPCTGPIMKAPPWDSDSDPPPRVHECDMGVRGRALRAWPLCGRVSRVLGHRSWCLSAWAPLGRCPILPGDLGWRLVCEMGHRGCRQSLPSRLEIAVGSSSSCSLLVRSSCCFLLGGQAGALGREWQMEAGLRQSPDASRKSLVPGP